jgi:anti-sigma regulatory factor (Ser/Thr protein kinase)
MTLGASYGCSPCLPKKANSYHPAIVAEVEKFAHGAEQTDDITVLTFQFMHGASGDTEPTETVVIRNHLSELDRVDATVERFGERTGLPAEALSRLRIVCDDVLSNVIAYAFPDDGEHDVEVRLAMVGRRLVVRVSDDGIPFDPLTVAPPDLNAPLAQRQIGGLGIHLVRSLFDEVTYERRADRNVLTLASKVADEPGRPERLAEHDTPAQGG